MATPVFTILPDSSQQEKDTHVKHINTISRSPRQAQTLNITAIFTLVANVLFTVSTAVLAKENSEFPGINLPGGGES